MLMNKCMSTFMLFNKCYFIPATVCSADQFQCLDSKCVDKDWHCDGDFDCDDHSDELNCPSNPDKDTCLETEWACQIEEQCILQNWKCDGEVDCFDGSDELNCKIFYMHPLIRCFGHVHPSIHTHFPSGKTQQT